MGNKVIDRYFKSNLIIQFVIMLLALVLQCVLSYIIYVDSSNFVSIIIYILILLLALIAFLGCYSSVHCKSRIKKINYIVFFINAVFSFYFGTIDLWYIIIAISVVDVIIEMIYVYLGFNTYKDKMLEVFKSLTHKIEDKCVNVKLNPRDIYLPLFFSIGLSRIPYVIFVIILLQVSYCIYLIIKHNKQKVLCISLTIIIAIIVGILTLYLFNGQIAIKDTNYKDCSIWLFLIYIPASYPYYLSIKSSSYNSLKMKMDDENKD